ncbi:cysteine--tRNA ligase [Patescibacteria group bacterium]|nr:cysteine--tRNA ligase [Patescibacteria group bacterium]
MLKIYNTASRKLETIEPIKKGKIGFYACGPTVYQRAHIGNFRTYIMEDVLRRLLEHHGLKVYHVMNITDVGHLTDDADQGEDKLEKAARKTGKTAWDISHEITDLFLQDMKRLNIEKPNSLPRATDNIDVQIALIERLEKKGYTYKISDGIYFDTSKFKRYGKFSGQSLESKKAGARVKVGDKKNPTDFALWKFSPKKGKRQMEWKSPWGVGFPGWHIECSAMSRKELGQPFDIHAGGVDHVPVHHENEIAQSEAAYGSKLAKYWIHHDHLLVDGGKMSKSLKNDYSLDDVEKKGLDPLVYRYFILGAHYRQKQNFTWKALGAAQSALNKLRMTVRDWDKPKLEAGSLKLEGEFFAALDDDLNASKALAVLWKLVDSDATTSKKSATILKMDEVLGLGLDKYVAKPVKIPKDIQALLDKRAQARKEKNFKKSDKLRDQLSKKGWIVEDTKEGQKAVLVIC